MDPVRDMNMNQIDFVSQYKRLEFFDEPLRQSKCHTCPKLEEHVRRGSVLLLEDMAYVTDECHCRGCSMAWPGFDIG